jgi:predicted amidophosphoribosyltransferase
MTQMLAMVDNIDKIIKESINLIVEGLDLDPVYGTVSMNPNHQNYVDTNDAWSPQPYYTTINGYKVISLFKNKWEHNPLIWALKNKKWKFKNQRYDIMFLLRRLVAVTRELHEKFDVIITTPSSSKLNNELLSKVERLVPHSKSYRNFFTKYSAKEVFENLPNVYKERLMVYFQEMQRNNGGMFSYKYIPVGLRNKIGDTIRINGDLKLTNEINGKRILILDDTVTTGKTISDSARALMGTFTPKSITFFTLMTPQDDIS